MDEAEIIAEEINETPEVVTKVLRQVEVRIENNKRQPKPPAPEGGISIRAGSRKYNIVQSTISRWVQRGLIPVVLPTRNEKYINEKRLAELAYLYKKEPGQGKLTIKQTLNSA